jgi:CDP-diacylglycerol---glycerol-3-phosphate 3-phosphatidyltransferase
MWTLPNTLTLLRLVLVPVFLWQATRGTLSGSLLALAVFVVASVTDSLDGYYARKLGCQSDLGRFLDPLADKLLVLSAFYWAALGVGATRIWFSIWLVHLITVREVGVTLLRSAHRRRGRQVVTAASGKGKTVLQVIVLVTVLALEAGGRTLEEIGGPAAWTSSTAVWIIVQFFFLTAVALTVISGLRYFSPGAPTIPLTRPGGTRSE